MARYQFVTSENSKNSTFEIIKLCYHNHIPRENEKFDLFEIDAVTLCYSTVAGLAEALVKNHCINHNMYIFKIRYIHNREEKYLDTIVGDSFLLNCALYCCNQKRKGISSSKISISTNQEGFMEYVSRILNYMKDPVVSNYMLQDKNGLIPYYIRKAIISYRTLCAKSFLSNEDMYDMQTIKNQVIYTMQKYKHLRGIKIWEKQYLDQKDKIQDVSYRSLEEKSHLCSTTFGLYLGSPSKEIDSNAKEIDPDEFAYFTPEEKSYFTSGDEEAVYSPYCYVLR